MKYNQPHATAKWGTMAKDWELGVDYGRLIRERFERAQAAVKNFNVANAYFFNATK